MSNPYTQQPHSNPYSGGGPAPAGDESYGDQQGQPSPQGGPTRPAFVDPYQPRERQPSYPPAITRQELAQSPTSSSPAQGSQGSRGVPHISGNSSLAAKIGAVACLALTLLLLASHAALLALGVTAIFFAVCTSALPKTWAANAFNVIVLYLIQVIVLGIVLGLIDIFTDGTLRTTVGMWIRLGFILIFLASAVAAGFGKYFRIPLQIKLLPS